MPERHRRQDELRPVEGEARQDCVCHQARREVRHIPTVEAERQHDVSNAHRGRGEPKGDGKALAHLKRPTRAVEREAGLVRDDVLVEHPLDRLVVRVRDRNLLGVRKLRRAQDAVAKLDRVRRELEPRLESLADDDLAQRGLGSEPDGHEWELEQELRCGLGRVPEFEREGRLRLHRDRVQAAFLMSRFVVFRPRRRSDFAVAVARLVGRRARRGRRRGVGRL